MSEFLHMGGYGAYVWSAYAVWLVVMIANFVLPKVRARNTLRRLARSLNEERERT